MQTEQQLSAAQNNSLAALQCQANWMMGYFTRQAQRILRKDND